MDGGSRGAKVFRHQLGTLHSEDVLIYEEKNPDFTVSGINHLPSLIFYSREYLKWRLHNDKHSFLVQANDE